jgi:glycosyltransferase involved in cell wall biosynthesis
MDDIPVLHVPFTFFPDQPGGTEIYVAALIAGMREHGYDGVVAAPAERESIYDHSGIRVYRFNRNPLPSLDAAYGAPDEMAAQSFRKIIERVKPRILHIHAHTAAVSERLMDEASMIGAKIFFTYHTPTVSCVRGTRMFMGDTVCDGVLDARRCAVCTLQMHRIPEWAGKIITGIPASIGRAMTGAGISGDIVTAVRIPALVTEAHGRFRSLMAKCDRVVAVCQWVMEMLTANGVSVSKLRLCRQGLPSDGIPREPAGNRAYCKGPIRLGYFGRLDSTKGLDVVLDALRWIPEVPVVLDVYGIEQPGSAAYVSRLRGLADSRVTFRNPAESSDVSRAMAECDFIIAPSRWLETGPLVVYEAFGAGTPVLGSCRGGIAELVTDGVDGVLIEPNDIRAWANVIAGLAADPDEVARLRDGVRAPRTMRDAAREMAAHYQSVLASVA